MTTIQLMGSVLGLLLLVGQSLGQLNSQVTVNGIRLGMTKTEIMSVLRSQERVNPSAHLRGQWSNPECETDSDGGVHCDTHYSVGRIDCPSTRALWGGMCGALESKGLGFDLSVASHRVIYVNYSDWTEEGKSSPSVLFERTVSVTKRKFGKESFDSERAAAEERQQDAALRTQGITPPDRSGFVPAVVWLSRETYRLPDGKRGLAHDGSKMLGADSRYLYKIELIHDRVWVTLLDRKEL
jgi:hypothetical protein